MLRAAIESISNTMRNAYTMIGLHYSVHTEGNRSFNDV